MRFFFLYHEEYMHTRILAFSILAISSLLLISPIYAQDGAPDRRNPAVRERAIEAVAERVETRTATREATREAVTQKRTELRADLEAERKKAQAANQKDRAAFQKKLQEISDEKKQEIVEDLDDRITKQNERLTDRLLDRLTKISDVLDRLDSAAAELEDAENLVEAVSEARTAIDAAEKAIADQAGKDYVFAIDDEETVGEVVRKAVQDFRADMKKAIDLVKGAHEATRNVAQELASYRDQNAGDPKDVAPAP